MNDFTYDEVLDLWIAPRKFLNYDIEVRLYCGKGDNLQQLATRAINDIGNSWGLIKTAIIEELLPLYLDHATEELDGEAFFAKLPMKTIDLDAVDIMYTLFFGDGGLFGGHGIQVLWDPGEEFSADVSLVG